MSQGLIERLMERLRAIVPAPDISLVSDSGDVQATETRLLDLVAASTVLDFGAVPIDVSALHDRAKSAESASDGAASP